MIIGVPKETKQDEYRVAMLPVGVHLLTQAGHTVLVQASAGVGSGYDDGAYAEAGARIVAEPEGIFYRGELIIKVKEPLEPEWPLLQRGQLVFTYFHFAASRDLTMACLEAGITALAYETLTDSRGRLPLLIPMSEVAGRMSIQEGAKYLERPMMGRGILLGGVAGVDPGYVLVLGGGVVGSNAARVAAGLGARVTVMDINLDRLRYLEDVMPGNVDTLYSDPHAVAEHIAEADLVIGALLVPGGRTPVLVDRAMLATMKNGAVVVDVGVDQGGCMETTRPTTHSDPTYIEEGVVHYCVGNMPGAVGRTSTQALCHATQPYVLQLADAGPEKLLNESESFAAALNMRDGKLTNQAVAAAHDLKVG